MLTSLQNSKVKYLVKLREKKKQRKEDNCFLVEGYRELSRALKCGYSIKELFFCSSVLSEDAKTLLLNCSSNSTEVSDDVFKKIAMREGSDGLLAVLNIPTHSLSSIKVSNKTILVALDEVEKPGNLGAILRSSDAVGVRAIVLLNSKVDAYNPSVVRTSLGALFSVPVIECGNDEFFDFCKDKNIKTVAASPFATEYHYESDLTGPVVV